MNPRARRLRRQRRKNDRDPFRHVAGTRRSREERHCYVVQQRLSRAARRDGVVRERVAVAAAPPLTGGALLTTMLQGKPVA